MARLGRVQLKSVKVTVANLTYLLLEVMFQQGYIQIILKKNVFLVKKTGMGLHFKNYP